MNNHATSSSSNPAPFELYAIRYANHSNRKSSDNMIGGDLHEEGSDLDYFVWVARRAGEVFLIDTGFGREAAAQRGRTLLQTPAEAVALLGIDAAEIRHVILTHLHYDHAGTLSDFPAAQFHVQDSEAAFATGRCMCHDFLRAPYDVEDVVSFIRHVYADRVKFHDSDVELAEGLSLHRVGGHTAGMQMVRVWTKRGWVVLASDASHLYANFQSRKAFPAVYHLGELLEGYGAMDRLADSADHIIPGHDPLVMRLYPTPSPDMEGVIVSLDVEPEKL
ncbi:N-acyl homoserine lactonase family protein [Marinobacter sp. 71-i]|uniref:N-acyl homoserine lactonase family protein n=1 Tax=Marinobacter iranensis TaxID=2962607 RepID=A0ABT5Y7C2_9GAMM|nr:N-acyl homoserine lactonase family protein [Marinobacter iranensis]MDF0749578.1 N-acyl homoserine lactonase family protein [Marinobacter iranensis]